MISKLMGTWLMLDSLVSLIAFRQQRRRWQAVRLIRLVLGGILLWKWLEES